MRPGQINDIHRAGWLLMTALIGMLLLALIYRMYQKASIEDQIANRGISVVMKITARERGAGTLKFPDYIYAEHQGIQYSFPCARKYFRHIAKADSIRVRLDSSTGRATLPGKGRVRHLAPLFCAIIAIALVMIVLSAKQLFGLANQAPNGIASEGTPSKET